jgi:hypothetical protein
MLSTATSTRRIEVDGPMIGPRDITPEPPSTTRQPWEGHMADLLFVAVIIAFFAVCLLLVKACDRIIGPDDGQLDEDVTDLEVIGR